MKRIAFALLAACSSSSPPADPPETCGDPIDPGPAVSIGGSVGITGQTGAMGIFTHDTVARGDRAYAIWPVNPTNGTTVSVQVARSDDGGATWPQTAPAITAALKSGTNTTDAWAECTAIAIDAMDPDTVYAVARISGGNSVGATVGYPDEPTLVYAVSTDGGATFSTNVLRATVATGICADVISPAHNNVVVIDPVDDCANDRDAYVFADPARGAAFATGDAAPDDYEAHGSMTGLKSIDGRACGDAAHIDVEQNGNGAAGGEATESPRLFTDGVGKFCIGYVAVSNGLPGTPEHAYVECSTNLGGQFTLPTDLDPDAPAGSVHSQTVGAFGPNSKLAVVFMRGDATNGVFPYLAMSGNQGEHFDPAVQIPTYMNLPAVNPSVAWDADGTLWVAYRVDDGGFTDRIAVDKSCDGGATWVGATLVGDGNMKWPSLFGDAPHVAASAADHVSVFAL